MLVEGLYSDEKLEGIAVLGNPPPEASMIDLLLVIDGQKDVHLWHCCAVFLLRLEAVGPKR